MKAGEMIALVEYFRRQYHYEHGAAKPRFLNHSSEVYKIACGGCVEV